MNRWFDQFRGLVMAVAVLMIVLTASVRGYLGFINGAMYDWISILDLRTSQIAPSPTILIDMDPIVFHSVSGPWEDLLATLSTMNPLQIVLLEHPRRLSTESYEVIARQVDFVGFYDSPEDFGMAGEAFAGKRIHASLPISERGVFRRIPLVNSHTLLAAIIEKHQGWPFVADNVYPNFLQSFSEPPRISAQRFWNNEIPADFVRSKTILIAPRSALSAPDLFTPGAKAAETDVAGFQARAIQSVLADRNILPVPFVYLVAGLIVLAIACLYFYQRVNLTVSIYFSITSIVVFFSMSVGLLHYFFMMFPLAETLGTMFGVWVIVLNRKYVAEQQGMLLELNNISRLMQKRMVPDDLLHDSRYWEKIGRLVQQLLQLDRSIFLETLPGQRRLQEIHAINCDLSAINEHRRDYERTPYTTAIHAHEPLSVTGYLNDASEREHQFLVPLSVEGVVLGFWAFSFEAQIVNRDDTLRVAARLADEIAGLLQQRKQMQERARREHRRWADYIALQGGPSLSRDLKDALNITTKRLQVIEDLFATSESALLLYDSFGQLLLENTAAARLCGACEIDAYTHSYNDMLGCLAGLEPSVSQAHLQRVFFTGAHVILPLNTGVDDLTGEISVSMLTGSSADTELIQLPRSLQRFGVVLEIHFGGQASKSSLPQWIPQILDLQNDHPKVQLWQQAHDYFAACGDELQPEALPLLQSTLAETRKDFVKKIRRKRLALDIESQQDVQVMLPITDLKFVLGALLGFAIEDAKLGSKIKINIDATWPELKMDVCVDGVGSPQAPATTMNSSAQLMAAAEHPVDIAIGLVERYRGRVEISSEIGVGCSIEMALPSLPLPGGQ